MGRRVLHVSAGRHAITSNNNKDKNITCTREPHKNATAIAIVITRVAPLKTTSTTNSKNQKSKNMTQHPNVLPVQSVIRHLCRDLNFAYGFARTYKGENVALMHRASHALYPFCNTNRAACTVSCSMFHGHTSL